MVDIDFSGLLAQYSTRGRNGFNPIMMYATVVYAAMRGIRSVDTVVDLCRRDLAFIWLTQGKQPKRDAFYEFKNLRLTEEVLEDLHYPFVRRLQKEGLVTLKELYKYHGEKDRNKNKVMKINERWEELKEETHANIQSGKGMLNRQIRSIQTEGDFGDIKENEDFRRFHYRSSGKVYREFLMYAIGRNLNKYHRFSTGELKKYEPKSSEKVA